MRTRTTYTGGAAGPDRPDGLDWGRVQTKSSAANVCASSSHDGSSNPDLQLREAAPTIIDSLQRPAHGVSSIYLAGPSIGAGSAQLPCRADAHDSSYSRIFMPHLVSCSLATRSTAESATLVL